MYQIAPYAQSANPYSAYSYPTAMPQAYTAMQPANDPFYNAAAWRAAMPTPNLTFNYNMGAGQSQGYQPYSQPASPYAQFSQYGQQYPSAQQYGQYPQASQFNPMQQQQYSPYGQTASAYPYGQAAGAYAQGGYNPYAMQPGVSPMGGDMFGPAGAGFNTGMDALSNPATTGVDNLMQPAPAAPPEKKSSFWKWVVGLAAAGGLGTLIYNWTKEDPIPPNEPEETNNETAHDTPDIKPQDSLKSAITAKGSINTLLSDAEIKKTNVGGDVEATVKAFDAVLNGTKEDADAPLSTLKLQDNGKDSKELTAYKAASTKAKASIEAALKLDKAPADKLGQLKTALETQEKHVDELLEAAKPPKEEPKA